MTVDNVQASIRPLAVDLDGTLIKTDLLVESFFALCAVSPWRAFKTLLHVLKGKTALKMALAEHISPDVSTLPYDETVLRWVAGEKSRGRRVYLASASSKPYVEAVAKHLGLFDGVFSSDAETNLKGETKARVLCQAFGRGGFDYVGDAPADLAVWQAAGGVVLANARPYVVRIARERFPEALVITPEVSGGKDYLRLLRVHQWLKNLLIIVPAFTAHHFTFSTAWECLLAFISFSLCASGVYVLNDLCDLSHDRAHVSKRDRPLAAGRINPLHAVALLPVLFGISLGMGLLLPWRFMLVLCGYFAVTFAYSVYLKRQMALDVIALACLYSVRLLAGAVAVSVPLSPWLVAFALFFFLGLALVKRCSELLDGQQRNAGDPAGRAYRLEDLPVLQMMAAASSYVAVLVFGLYINSAAVAHLYGAPYRLWAIPVILLYWVSRVLMLTHRGQMHEDPVLFAARDRISLICAGLIVLVVLWSM